MNLMIEGNMQEEYKFKTNENADNEVKTFLKVDSARGSNTKRRYIKIFI